MPARSGGRSRPAARPVTSALLSLLIALAVLLAAPAPAVRAQVPDGCPEVIPTDELEPGMDATGYTVAEGDVIETFDVEILGVLADGVGPGRDMVIVDTDSPAIEAAGGIWSGMSGSPVFIDDRLVGAIAYGLSGGNSSIGGVTAAADMVALLDLPAAEAAGQRPVTPPEDDAPVPVAEPRATGELGRMVAEREGRAARAAGETFRPLTLPLAVSGLSSTRLPLLGEAARKAGLPVVPYVSSAVATSTALTPADETPEAGGNFAAALSYGDITAAGIGTTTLVCDGEAVAFGHPFNFSGATTMGANLADAIGVINDAIFPGFKLANVGGLVGTVDQDRLAGIRTVLGATPSTVQVLTEVTDRDLSHTRAGRTDVVFREGVPFLAPAALLANADVTIDRVGPGAAELTYQVVGSTPETGTFTVERSNRFVSDFDVSFESTFELQEHLARLAAADVDGLQIERVELDLAVERAVRRYTVQALRVGVDGGEPEEVMRVEAHPGAALTLEVDLRSSDGTARTVALELVVPEEADGFAFLTVGAGSAFTDACVVDPTACPTGSLEELIERLESAPRNDELIARLSMEGMEGGGDGPAGADCVVTILPDGSQVVECSATGSGRPGEPPGGAGSEPVEARELLDQVLAGELGVEVDLGGGCPDCPPEVLRAAGADRIATAVAVSEQVYEQAATALLARADAYPDALAGAPLATQLGAPVLLSAGDALPEVVAQELTRLGVERVIVLGGEAALGAAVIADLEEAGVAEVERIAGPDRFATAALVAARLLEESGAAALQDAYVAAGAAADPARGWPDALSASGVAALEGRPVLLVTQDGLPEATAGALEELDVQRVTVVGGRAAVADSVAAALTAAGVAVERVAGADRYETSFAMAERAVAAGASPLSSWLATGRAFPDALVGGAAAAASGGVLLLTDGHDIDASPTTGRWLEMIAGPGARVVLLGGTAAISEEAEAQVTTALAGEPVG